MMSATKKYLDVPGFIRDPETGRYIPGNPEEFLHFGATRKSPRNVAKTGQGSTQTNSRLTERGSTKRVCKDLPGFIQDPETGKFQAVPFDVKDMTVFNNSPANCYNDSPQPNKFQKNDQGARKELFTKPLPATRLSLRRSHIAKKPLKKSVIPSIVVSKTTDNQLAVPFPPTPVLNLRPPKQEFIQPQKAFKLPETETNNDDLKIFKTQEIILKNIENLFKLCQETSRKLDEFQQVQQQQGEDIKKILTIVASQYSNKNDNSIEKDKECTPLKQKLSSHHPKLYITKYSASKKPSTNISSIQEEESPIIADFKTPDSHQDTDEFVKMEQLCLTPKNASVTPISTVCNLFKTMDVEEANVENPLKRRSSLLKAMDVYDSPKRRSLRLKEKIFDNNQVSPVVMKSDDLRKSTLTRSLVKKYQVDSPKSPRTRKAFDMYVSTKKDYDYLLTPSFSKQRPLLTDSGNSARKRISEKVQQQCLLLQDTP